MACVINVLRYGSAQLKRRDDDAFDRLSNRYTIGVILVGSTFLAIRAYVGDPITCFTPKEFVDNWIRYADNYCWIKNTYYVSINEDLPGPKGLQSPDHSSGPEISYYQWVPIILAFTIFVLSIPAYFWKFAMWSSGYDVEAIVRASSDSENLDPAKRDDTIKYIASQLHRHINYHRHQSGLGKIHLGNKYGRRLFFMYIITKCLYLTMPILLLFILTGMMGNGYGDYGWRALMSLGNPDDTFLHNPMFPLYTYCDFAVRKMAGNVQRYTVQCNLMVNLFNQVAFLILWWWLVVLAGLTAIGLFICLVKNLRPNGSRDFIVKYLKCVGVLETKSVPVKDISIFTEQYLSLDGVFCMRLLAQNTTDVVAAEIITELYKRWKSMHSKGNSSSGSQKLLTDETA